MAAPSLRRGAFVVFEGVDRSGKSTQCRRVVDALLAKGLAAVAMNFPDRTTTIGTMINAYLQNKAEVEDHAIHLLFAANRWERSPSLCETLHAGTTIICDRYSYSGIAFSAAKGLDMDWCAAPEIGLPQPDLVVFLDLSIEETARRGGYGAERYEKDALQRAVRSSYARLRSSDWAVIDAAQPVDELTTSIASLVESTIARVETSPIGRFTESPVRTQGTSAS